MTDLPVVIFNEGDDIYTPLGRGLISEKKDSEEHGLILTVNLMRPFIYNMIQHDYYDFKASDCKHISIEFDENKKEEKV